MRSDEVAELHARIRRAAEGASSVAPIARSLGCSRTTVDRALSRDPDAAPDARASNGGRPRTFDEAVRSAVHKAREQRAWLLRAIVEMEDDYLELVARAVERARERPPAEGDG